MGRYEARVVGEESGEVHWGDPDTGGIVGEAEGVALVRVVREHAVGDRCRARPRDQSTAGVGNQELPVTLVLLMVIGPPAKMPPPSHAAVLSCTTELLSVVGPAWNSRHRRSGISGPPVEWLFETVELLIVAVPLLTMPPPPPAVFPDTVELLSTMTDWVVEDAAAVAVRDDVVRHGGRC